MKELHGLRVLKVTRWLPAAQRFGATFAARPADEVQRPASAISTFGCDIFDFIRHCGSSFFVCHA
jgi:hypothetical protein